MKFSEIVWRDSVIEWHKISAGERPAAAPLLRCWVRIPPGHEYFSIVSVVCCQVEVSATS
jgi:hypothetical protein